MDKIKNSSKFSKGFTLLELLVVVLIIGILAGIALPQYKMAIGKAKFSTCKNITRSAWDSAQRYYLVNSTYPQATADLDIGLNIKKEKYTTNGYLEFTTTDDINCTIWDRNPNLFAACDRKIAGKKISFYVKADGSPLMCIVFTTETNTKDIPNKICQQETGKKASYLLDNAYYQYLY